MRSIRLTLLLLCTSIFLISLLYLSIAPTPDDCFESNDDTGSQRSLRAFFSFRSPGSLFAPSATISLTDDNSTYFAASPAAFGPLIASRGLSGEIWIGSGFGDDNLRARGLATTLEGELGCGDIPGWYDRDRISEPPAGLPDVSRNGLKDDLADKRSHNRPMSTSHKRSGWFRNPFRKDLRHDGTDDAYHYPLSATSIYRSSSTTNKEAGGSANIKSLQESAEIAGKVVLLSRGGCGFSEKVKWAQRRGARAVIVGDNIRGGPLIRMYARGDNSNITIPSLFTSHTTAHLLSSLVPPGSDVDSAWSNAEAHVLTVRDSKLSRIPSKSGPVGGRAGFADDENPLRHSTKYSSSSLQVNDRKPRKTTGLVWDKFNIFHSDEAQAVDQIARTPPRSGNVKWINAEDDEEQHSRGKKIPASSALKHEAEDTFVIGVHDWRDPDIVRHASHSTKIDTSSSEVGKAPILTAEIQPGSGENMISSTISSLGKHNVPAGSDRTVMKGVENSGSRNTKFSSMSGTNSDLVDDNGDHRGLWVTLTITSMSTNPFLHTLFVLVVSPLFTLAAVYTMLLVRSRVRQRRWRAPKSIVDQLPVRIYRTLSTRGNSGAASNNSTATPSSPTGQCTLTTPLLVPSQQTDDTSGPRPIHSNLTHLRSPTNYGSLDSQSTVHEKKTPGSSLPRRYDGKQVECCVCLEEYVDGVSKVMSLPCGHDFHVDCITPWLTTRRRTCPICKWDVVRSPTQRGSDEESSLLANELDAQARVTDTIDETEPTSQSAQWNRPSSLTGEGREHTSSSPFDIHEQGSSRSVGRAPLDSNSISSIDSQIARSKKSREQTPSPSRNA